MPDHEINDLVAFPVREPSSGRAYTIVRLRTRAGLTGFGECEAASREAVAAAKKAVIGRSAHAFATVTVDAPLAAAVNIAMLDIAARACNTPLYRFLGGPTRHKVRALTTLHGDSDAEVSASLAAAKRAGFHAVQAPLPRIAARNQGDGFAKAAYTRMEALRSGGAVEIVLDGRGELTPGDAATIAAEFERFHPLWFDEPCDPGNLRTVQKISHETVTPLGFGRAAGNRAIFQELLRDGLVDIVRPNLGRYGVSGIRHVAALAETYYVAVAPHHEGGPIATAAALHLAAALPNFFIQHIPFPASAADREMRAALVREPIETVKDGFASLPAGPGLGVTVNESALDKYKEAA